MGEEVLASAVSGRGRIEVVIGDLTEQRVGVALRLVRLVSIDRQTAEHFAATLTAMAK